MSKELEALIGLAQFIIMNDTGTDESASAIEWHGILKQALTPPTADEVIKALSEYFKGLTGVWYDKKTKSFIHLQYGRNEVISRCFEARLNDKRVTVIVTLPPHLITMIGKFYESLEEEKWQH